jgi:hypothetical protein
MEIGVEVNAEKLMQSRIMVQIVNTDILSKYAELKIWDSI